MEYVNFVAPVQPAPACRTLDVITGNKFNGDLAVYTELAVPSAKFELCDWGICFYFSQGSFDALTSAAS